MYKEIKFVIILAIISHINIFKFKLSFWALNALEMLLDAIKLSL